MNRLDKYAQPFAQALDDTLACLDRGEALDSCLAHHPHFAAELAPLVSVRARLEVLVPAPALSPNAIAARRRQFLTAARDMERQTPTREVGVWLAWLRNALSPVRASFALARVAIVCVLVVCAVTVTVGMAQASMPDSPLYGVKLALEDLQLSVTADPAQKAMLTVDFAAERAREIGWLVTEGRAIPAGVQQRLEEQLRAALQQVARMDAATARMVLTRLSHVAEAQRETLARAEGVAPTGQQEMLRQAEVLLEQAREQAEAELADPVRQPAPTPATQPTNVPTALVPAATQTPQPTPTAEAGETPTAEGIATATAGLSPTPYQHREGGGGEGAGASATQTAAPQGGATAVPTLPVTALAGPQTPDPQPTGQPMAPHTPNPQPTSQPTAQHTPNPQPTSPGGPGPEQTSQPQPQPTSAGGPGSGAEQTAQPDPQATGRVGGGGGHGGGTL